MKEQFNEGIESLKKTQSKIKVQTKTSRFQTKTLKVQLTKNKQ